MIESAFKRRLFVNNGTRYKLLCSLFKDSNKGVAAVEFALVIIPFLLLILFTMECSRMIYLYATIDLSLSEASQFSSNSRQSDKSGAAFDYETVFRKTFKNNINSIPLAITGDADQITINVNYCNNIDDIISNGCSSVNSKDKPLAVYYVTYKYKPLFFFFISDIFDFSLARNIVYVQEYERFSL